MLSSLKATQIVVLKPTLPAELISVILDYLPPDSLIRCAQVSRKLKETVYDNSRWINKLRAIGVWDENEARQRQENALHRRPTDAGARIGGGPNGSITAGGGHTATLFDIDAGGQTRNRANSHRKRPSLSDGFDDMTLASPTGTAMQPSTHHTRAISVIRDSRSMHGQARQSYGKIHAALNPFYVDITRPEYSTDPMVFRVFHEPQQQAQVLSNLGKYGQADNQLGWQDRVEKLQDATNSFQNRIMSDLRNAYAEKDVPRMHSSVVIATILDGGQSAVDVFIDNHPLMTGTQRLANPLDCVEGVASGHVDLSPSQRFFQRLAGIFSEQTTLIDEVFSPSQDVLDQLLRRVSTKVIQDFVDAVLNATRNVGKETYLKSVPGVFEQCMRFSLSIQPSKASPKTFQQDGQALLLKCFDKHIDLYLAEELDWFKAKAEEGVQSWEHDLSEQESRNESFFMSNVNRQAAKRDFLSSFKKVVMMPVNAVAAFPLPGGGSKSHAPILAESEKAARPTTPVLTSSAFAPNGGEAPTTELAAKAAIMNSRLEGIKSLFSIEVALNLVHLAKVSIERIAILTRQKTAFSKEAAQQCEAIFIALVQILGQRHIRTGFDKAVTHLTSYNPTQAKALQSAGNGASAQAGGVEPLVTFLELVNVGDLIQQMVDVFYAQELVSAQLTDRDDFLNPAAKEKKAFEQMLDERVAAGMSKGIDVLMGEVEYLCATTQAATDFNPGADGSDPMKVMDIGPSTTATQIVALVESHTAMLVGSTEKSMLDVFFQEVGLRLFSAVCKHIKRQRISVDGAIKLIRHTSDINLYSSFIASLKQKPLVPYTAALRELSGIYLVDCTPAIPSTPVTPRSAKPVKSPSSAQAKMYSSRAKELAAIIADNDRYKGVFGVDEVLEFAERRADWYAVRGDVERAMYGIGCLVM
ncbi:hypothetical protein K461DRAFT_298972 [Myriangium duriaei CBS 260.36]|uniref:F-box domain-containing protein n=1 Tax=Myriangium duriaei CBS 260.36 TaxID=1168546 RepID=A0A9P4MJC0_9PEZI|nr:hypothetical protein K461DRAFT_298972 [Myriangium duriaei CBS 260.36]